MCCGWGVLLKKTAKVTVPKTEPTVSGKKRASEGVMRKALVVVPIVAGGVILGCSLMPAAWRERIAQRCGNVIGRMIDHMPDH